MQVYALPSTCFSHGEEGHCRQVKLGVKKGWGGAGLGCTGAMFSLPLDFPSLVAGRCLKVSGKKIGIQLQACWHVWVTQGD